MIGVVVYLAVLTAIGVAGWRRRRDATVEGFVTYGRGAGGGAVAMSLVALVFGASSVFGLAGYAYRYGMNALWWTLSGAIFLVVLRATFLDDIVRLRAYTVSDIVARAFGEGIRGFMSAMTAAAWLMVLAGQIVAGGNILNLFVHHETAAYLLFTASFAGYTLLAGQAGPMRTGALQVVLMVAGLLALLAAALGSPAARPADLSFRMGFDAAFTPGMWLGILVPVGLSYLFGPDIYSRVFTARDIRAARRGVLLTAVLVVAVSLVIVTIGMLGRGILGEVPRPDNVIPLLVPRFLSGWQADLVVLSLVSIPLSGADVILMTIGTLLGRDLASKGFRRAGIDLGERREIHVLRACIAAAALASALIALRLKAIIPSLLIAYKVFSIGIVPMIFVSLLALRRGVRIDAPAARWAAGVYLLASSLAVLAAELKVLPALPPNYNLYALGANTLLLWAIARAGGRAVPGS